MQVIAVTVLASAEESRTPHEFSREDTFILMNTRQYKIWQTAIKIWQTTFTLMDNAMQHCILLQFISNFLLASILTLIFFFFNFITLMMIIFFTP